MARFNYRLGGAEKKLIEAAEFLAGGGTAADEPDEALADLEAMGAPAEIKAQLETQRQEDFEIWPENAPAVFLFLRVQTQWSFSAAGTATGLSYPGLEVAARLSGATMTPALFEDIRTLEIATLRYWAKRRAAERDKGLNRVA